MRKKLALVAFEKGVGPWIRAKGNEHQVNVRFLNDGEQLGMEVEGAIGSRHLREGLSSVTLEANQMYRFVKTVPEGQKPSRTCVEVLLGGAHSS